MYVVTIQKDRSQVSFFFQATSEQAAQHEIKRRLGHSGWQVVPTPR